MGTVSETRRLPFNSAVETGLKALVVLAEAYPRSYPLETLVIFDYLLVHSGDVDQSTTSLHPPTPMRSGELVVRRELVEAGLRLYSSRGLLQTEYNANGIEYAATEDSAPFLQSLDAGYVKELRSAAVWLVQSFGTASPQSLRKLVDERLGVWGTEFLVDTENGGWAKS